MNHTAYFVVYFDVKTQKITNYDIVSEEHPSITRAYNTSFVVDKAYGYDYDHARQLLTAKIANKLEFPVSTENIQVFGSKSIAKNTGTVNFH